MQEVDYLSNFTNQSCWIFPKEQNRKFPYHPMYNALHNKSFIPVLLHHYKTVIIRFLLLRVYSVGILEMNTKAFSLVKHFGFGTTNLAFGTGEWNKAFKLYIQFTECEHILRPKWQNIALDYSDEVKFCVSISFLISHFKKLNRELNRLENGCLLWAKTSSQIVNGCFVTKLRSLHCLPPQWIIPLIYSLLLDCRVRWGVVPYMLLVLGSSIASLIYLSIYLSIYKYIYIYIYICRERERERG